MISPLNRRSLHISELWTGWDTLEIVFILEHEYQTSKTRIISFSQTFKNPVWCELKGRKVEISARRGGSAAWQKKLKQKHVYKNTVLKTRVCSLPFLNNCQLFFCPLILQDIDTDGAEQWRPRRTAVPLPTQASVTWTNTCRFMRPQNIQDLLTPPKYWWM